MQPARVDEPGIPIISGVMSSYDAHSSRFVKYIYAQGNTTRNFRSRVLIYSRCGGLSHRSNVRTNPMRTTMNSCLLRQCICNLSNVNVDSFFFLMQIIFQQGFASLSFDKGWKKGLKWSQGESHVL